MKKRSTTPRAVPGPEPALLPSPISGAGDARTRDRVARTLLENGPMTAATLADRLGVTTAAVRRHLDAFLAAGFIAERETRPAGLRGRGRPARTFGLTATGRDTFDQAYDDLAASALRFLADHGGREAVAAFARQRVAELAARYRPIVDAVPEARRPEALAEALTDDGYAATALAARPPSGEHAQAGTSGGVQLCQHHCPVSHVAEQFPELCEAETEVFAKLLGTHVQRLATIAHGDGVCTTYVPRSTGDVAGSRTQSSRQGSSRQGSSRQGGARSSTSTTATTRRQTQ